MITSSVIIGLGSAVITGVFKLIAMKLEASREQREAELKAMNAKAQITKDAREYNNRGFQITRRFIAIATTLCVMVVPFIAVLYGMFTYFPLDAAPLPPVTFGYEVIDKGFWPFTSDATVTKWQEFRGIVITPWHTEMFAWIMGMYFGNRMGNGRM